jgi:hypothetical protein
VSEFEVMTITMSLVLGLGVAQLLTGVIDLVRSPEPQEVVALDSCNLTSHCYWRGRTSRYATLV